MDIQKWKGRKIYVPGEKIKNRLNESVTMNEKLEMSEKNKENKENVYTGVKDKENIREIREQKSNRKRRVSSRKKAYKLKERLKRIRKMLVQE